MQQRREWREGSVEADRQPGVFAARRPHLVDLLAGEPQGLLHEHGLAGAQRRGRDLGVAVVSRPDQHQVHLRVLDGRAPVGAGVGAAERARDVGRGRTASGDDGLDPHAVGSPEIRQVHPAHEVAGADERDDDFVRAG